MFMDSLGQILGAQRVCLSSVPQHLGHLGLQQEDSKAGLRSTGWFIHTHGHHWQSVEASPHGGVAASMGELPTTLDNLASEVTL